MSAQEPPVPVTVADDFTLQDGRGSGQHDVRSVSPVRSFKSASGFRAGVGLENVARRTLGIILLLVTVFLWTASNFLASVSVTNAIITSLQTLTSCIVVYLCGQHLLEAIFCDLSQYLVLCHLALTDFLSNRSYSWLLQHQIISGRLLAG